MRCFSLYRQNREFKLNQALAQSNQALAAIKIDSMLSYTTEAGISPRRATHFLSPESKQRARPDCPRPCAALRATCDTRMNAGADGLQDL